MNPQELQFALNLPFLPTETQTQIVETIIENPKTNYAIEAVAGAGKTTLIVILFKWFQNYASDKKLLYLTFSKRLATEAQSKLGKNSAKTVHSLTYGWAAAYLKKNGVKPLGSIVDDEMISKYVTRILERRFDINFEEDDFIPPYILKQFSQTKQRILELVDAAMLTLTDYTSLEELESLADANNLSLDEEDLQDVRDSLKYVIKNFKTKGKTTFTGLLWLPEFIDMTEHIQPVDVLLLDEGQDSSALLRRTYAKIISPSVQVIMVGDPSQAIMSFARVELESFEILRKMISAETLAYSDTFRVHKKMAEYLNRSELDSRIKAWHTNSEGEIFENFPFAKMLQEIQPGDAVLSRYNRGTRVRYTTNMVALALLDAGKRVALIGSSHNEDIREVLDEIDAERKKFDNLPSLAIKKYEQLIENERSKNRPKEWKISHWVEVLDTFLIYYKFFVTHSDGDDKNVKTFKSFVAGLYAHKSSGTVVTVISSFRSKGSEWRNVYIVNFAEHLPKEAYESSETWQEALNLQYVALTRGSEKTFIVEQYLPEKFYKFEEAPMEFKQRLLY